MFLSLKILNDNRDEDVSNEELQLKYKHF
jgi:hypothetical protein